MKPIDRNEYQLLLRGGGGGGGLGGGVGGRGGGDVCGQIKFNRLESSNLIILQINNIYIYTHYYHYL